MSGAPAWSSNGSGGEAPLPRGPIAWMARQRVAANLLLLFLLLGGLLSLARVRQEVFPRAQLDMVTVRIPYPSASPEEVEQGVILAVEEEVRSLEGVKEVRSVATEGVGVVNVELLLGADRDQMLNDVQSAVGRITSFPENAERPTVSLVSNRRQVISLIYHGDVSELALRRLAERARDELLERSEITLVQIAEPRPLEIAVEVPQHELRSLGLSLTDVARVLSDASIDLPAGDLETESGEIVLRTTEREETAEAFADVLLVSAADGAQVRLGDVGTVRYGFRDVDRAATYDGEPAVRLNVFRVGDQTPLGVARAVREFAEAERARLPDTVSVTAWDDTSQIYADRTGLLVKNGLIGLSLVLLLLGLFLEPRLAFWVTLGIPASFLGAFVLLPSTGVTINLISLFAFIVTLGLVVDDAIIVGEAIYSRTQQGDTGLRAAVLGAHDVARPVVFSILTTCIAFSPMLFVPGVAGQFFRNIPVVVILVLLISLVESLFVLPAHLAHPMPRLLWLLLRPYFLVTRVLRSEAISRWLDGVIERRYAPVVSLALDYRYATLAAGLLSILLVVGLFVGGRLDFRFLPEIEDDQVRATLHMPVGTPFATTREVERRIVRAARAAAARLSRPGEPDTSGAGRAAEAGGGAAAGGSNEREARLLQGVHSDLGFVPLEDMVSAASAQTGAHVARITADLVPAGERNTLSSEFAEVWRQELGELPEAESLVFSYSTGASSGAPIDVQLSHERVEVLREAASALAEGLSAYAGVRDVDDGFTRGKERLDFRLTEVGRAHGLTDAAFAQQLRAAFFGAEVQRIQRGRNEVRTYVRLPEGERRSLEDLEQLILRTPRGGELPLGRAADLTWATADTQIERTNMKRTVNVTAHVASGTNPNDVMADVREDLLPELEREYRGLRHAPGGEQQLQQESLESLSSGFALAVMAMFVLLSIAFGSYLQPLIVLCAIPFGVVGAVVGHLLLGYELSLMSLFGLVALSGVVVNDSLLLVVAINEARQGAPEAGVLGAALRGGQRRFRPILMTSLTTFFGLAPMIFETSVQARFLIPMAISLGFGILFATLVLLLIVPALYLALEDVRGSVRRGAARLAADRG